jgi:diphthamide synthase (EF-2-diphthine--ammonia ligase)
VLPPQTLIHTSWFHTDCIATRYGVEVWSPAHWGLVERYMRSAVTHGINMILTPVFTPPLDTRVGGERPTVQLVGVTRRGQRYEFDFARLDQWVALARRCGVQYFEISHLWFIRVESGHPQDVVVS